MRSLPYFALLAAPLTIACTDPAPAQSAPPPDGTDTLTIPLPEFETGPGDTFECFYTDVVTDRDLSVAAVSGEQGPGGHHITVYFTTPGDVGHHPCTEDEMSEWRMIGGADTAGSGEPVISLPEGLAYRLPAGRQIVAQVHYINTTGETQRQHDELTLHLIDPSKVDAYANLVTIVDLTFSLPPSSSSTAVSTAVLDQDLQLFWLGGHMHDLGAHYTLEKLDANGQVEEVMYDEDWSPEFSSHPPTLTYTMDDPLVLTQGTKLRQTCTWNNVTPEEVSFPREMCVAFGFYFPDNGTGEIVQLAQRQQP